MGPQMDNTQSRGYAAMDYSPSLEQTGGFTTVNGPYTPVNQSFASSPHHAPSYSPQQMPGFTDENIYNCQVLQQPHNGLGYDQMGTGMRSQGGVGYPPTSKPL